MKRKTSEEIEKIIKENEKLRVLDGCRKMACQRLPVTNEIVSTNQTEKVV
jgi:hypothetical protein